MQRRHATGLEVRYVVPARERARRQWRPRYQQRAIGIVRAIPAIVSGLCYLVIVYSVTAVSLAVVVSGLRDW